MNKAQATMNTVIGMIYLVASGEGLHGIFWEEQDIPVLSEETGEAEKAILRKTITQLDEYFNGQRTTFDIPLVIEGTPFQKKVWNALSQIPYGKTCSYKDVAEGILHNKAHRAVGTANGRNPHAIIVPCHRVIAADGSLGGYAGGLEIKKILLAIEKA